MGFDLVVLTAAGLFVVDLILKPDGFQPEQYQAYQASPTEDTRFGFSPSRAVERKRRALSGCLARALGGRPTVQSGVALVDSRSGVSLPSSRHVFGLRDLGAGLAELTESKVLASSGRRAIERVLSELLVEQTPDRIELGAELLWRPELVDHEAFDVRSEVTTRVRIYPHLQPNSDEFAREWTFLKSHSDPGILAPRESLSTRGVPVVSFEPFDALPLDLFLRRPHLDLGARSSIVLQLARALRFCHERGTVHGDLSPDVVLVRCGSDDRPQVRLLLGKEPGESAAQLSDDAALYFDLVYRDLEFIATGRIDPAEDVYALGTLAYLALIGERPTRARDEWRERARALLPPPLAEFVLRATRFHRRDRFADAEEAAEFLVAACQRSGIELRMDS